MTAEQSKPCPFCGTAPNQGGRGDVWCNNDACAIVGLVFSGGAHHWNRRTPVEQLSAQTATKTEQSLSNSNMQKVHIAPASKDSLPAEQPIESNVQKVNIAPTSANFARVQTDEQIEEIWNSLGYRTKFAPYMLRLVHAVRAHAVPPPGYWLAPDVPHEHMLRPFVNCPEDELLLGYQAMKMVWKAYQPVSSHPVKAMDFSDESLVKAAHSACGIGRVALTFVNNDGIEKPTDVAKCFARALSTMRGKAQEIAAIANGAKG